MKKFLLTSAFLLLTSPAFAGAATNAWIADLQQNRSPLGGDQPLVSSVDTAVASLQELVAGGGGGGGITTITAGAGVSLSSGATCTASCTISVTSPTNLSNLTVSGSFTATGLVTNADLVNTNIIVNGQTCTLGGGCTVTAAATGIAVGTTTVSSASNGFVLYSNAGILGNLAASTVVNGQTCSLGSTCTVTAAAGTLTGSTLASGVTASSLTSVGTITTGVWNGTIVSASFLPVDVAYLDVAQNWTKSQRGVPQTCTLATATCTPNFDNGNNINLTLSSACPCTFANPSTTPVAGQTGIIQIVQDGTGSRTITTWGSSYVASGGVSVLALSTAASAKDIFSYYVIDSTHILIATGGLNVTH